MGRWQLLEHRQDAFDEIELLRGARQPDHMMTFLPNDLTVGQGSNDLALSGNEISAESEWSSAPGCEALGRQLQLGVNHLFRKIVAELAALLEFDAGCQQLATVLALAALQRRTCLIHVDQGDAESAKFLLEHDAIDGAIGASQPVAARNEHMGNGAVANDLGLHRVERRARELISFHAKVKEDVFAVMVLARLDQPVDLGGGTTELDTKFLGSTSSP